MDVKCTICDIEIGTTDPWHDRRFKDWQLDDPIKCPTCRNRYYKTAREYMDMAEAAGSPEMMQYLAGMAQAMALVEIAEGLDQWNRNVRG